jgi:hypothetical protein
MAPTSVGWLHTTGSDAQDQLSSSFEGLLDASALKENYPHKTLEKRAAVDGTGTLLVRPKKSSSSEKESKEEDYRDSTELPRKLQSLIARLPTAGHDDECCTISGLEEQAHAHKMDSRYYGFGSTQSAATHFDRYISIKSDRILAPRYSYVGNKEIYVTQFPIIMQSYSCRRIFTEMRSSWIRRPLLPQKLT